MHRTTQCRKSQSGAVAIVVGVSIAVLIGFAGLALDLGRLYINKTELQNAADACALAAAPYLDCDPDIAGSCPADKSNLEKAKRAGIFAAAQNKRDFQESQVSIVDGDVRFSPTLAPNDSYKAVGEAPADSKYVMCIARSTGIIPWFMGVLGVTEASNVNAFAVATLGPGQSFCGTAPMGICAKNSSVTYGYSANEWISLNVNVDKNDEDDVVVDTNSKFRWIDFDPNQGGADEVRDRLAGQDQVCGLEVGDNVREMGAKQGVKSAYNTRFGLYKNGSGNEKKYSPANAPPDKTGYAFPTNTKGDPVIEIGQDAYGSYRSHQGSFSPFDKNAYDGKEWGQVTDSNAYKTGRNRRLIAVPMIACPGPGKDTPILDMACVLMLNPMNTGTGQQTLYLQYLGLTKTSTEPECSTVGLPGGGGPQVPMLVQ